MLEILRQGANSLFAKLLMGLLVISFGVWGVRYSDIGGGTKTLLQVGGQNITTEQYQRMFGAELRKFELQAHQTVPVQTAHQMGLDQQLFSGLLVDAHARDLNLGISDKALLDKLASQKNLQTADGQFDKDNFRYLLQNLGLSEAGYLDMLRHDTLREQLLGSMGSGAPAPQALVDAFNQFQGEERSLDYFLVPPSKAPVAATPDEGKLKDFYEAHKDQYKAPEYRTLGVLLASPDDIKSTVTVGDDDLKAAYEATKDSFGKPERRHVQVMSFQDKASVDKAMTSLKTGKDFLAVAKDMGLTDKDVDRGMVTKDQLFDKVAAEAAFKLDKDKVSDPVEGALATSIIRVTEIEPGVVKTFDDVKGEIRDRLSRERSVKLLIDFRGKIEDARAGGTQLKEMPAKFPFKYSELPVMDKTGTGIDGKPASTLSDLDALLKAGFQSDIGVETDPIDLGKDGWAWIEVKDVKAARQKSLDEVKPAVLAAYQEAEATAALGKLALALADRTNKGEDFAKLATEGGGTVKAASGLTRRGENPDLPKGTAQLAFALAKGAAATLTGTDGKSRLVFKVTDIKPAKPLEDAKRKDIAEKLGQQAVAAASAQYLAGLETAYGFSLDRAQFDQLTGAAASTDQTDQ